MAVTGQINPQGKIDGLVRAIYSSGYVYEGNMTPDGNKNGFGVQFFGSYAFASWWKDNLYHGNFI